MNMNDDIDHTIESSNDSPPQTCYKIPYSSKKQAITKINNIMSSRRKNRPKFLRTYHCPDCGNHHITHNKDRE
jgi:predicted RNA-binding Zn-ribbon protein involved in translation (DUF1610 family)